MSRTAATPALFIVPLFWSTQRWSIAIVRSLLGIDGVDHHLLGGSERSCGGAGREAGDSEERAQEL